MAIYVVMEPPAAHAVEATERAAIVRDGFALLAFFVPPLWLLWHRLWIEAALVFAAGVSVTALAEAAGLGLAGVPLSLLVSLFVGLEGQGMRVNAMRRRGWREWGVVDAGSTAEAEIRYLAGEADGGAEPPRQTAAAPAIRPMQTGPALGLLGYPGRQ